MAAFHRHAIGLACGVAAALIWAGGAVVTRHLVTTRFPAIDLALLRYIGCFPVAVVALAFWHDRCRLEVSWPRLAVLQLLAGPPYQFLVIAGYEFATAGAGTLLISGLLPIFSLVLAAWFTGAQPTVSSLTGGLLAAGGIALFALARGQAMAFTGAGLLIFGAAALLWAVLNHLVRRWLVSPWRLTIALAVWSPVFLPFYWALRPMPVSDLVSRDGLIQLVYHGWLVAFAATLLFFTAVRLCGVVTASTLQALSPGLSAVLGAIVLAEAVSPLQSVGILLTTAGVALVTYAGGTAPAKPTPSSGKAG